jgi:nucleotide sugar dehydrogenase
MKSSKHISIIGIGKLGLCLGINLSKAGWDITGVDIRKEYINSLKNNTFESNEEFVNEYIKDCDIKYTTSIEDSLKSDIIFVVVSTPSTIDFKYDHSSIDKIADELIKYGKQKNRKDLIINCTTFPGYCDSLQEKLADYNYFVSYNPEFIAQGTIIRDQLNCDNVLIGQADEYAGNLIESVYKSFVLSQPVYNKMTRTEAEITKISVNCFLTTKISYANMISDIADRYGCNGNKILEAVSTDSRIEAKYLKPGFGYGGPCFPRDNRALAKCAEEVGVKAAISLATDEMNELHLKYQIENFVKLNPDKTKPVEIDYVTYKKESDSLEESQQLKFAVELKKLGYSILIKDKRPSVIEQVKNIL